MAFAFGVAWDERCTGAGEWIFELSEHGMRLSRGGPVCQDTNFGAGRPGVRETIEGGDRKGDQGTIGRWEDQRLMTVDHPTIGPSDYRTIRLSDDGKTRDQGP